VRWAYGQQTLYQPEYMWIKVKVHDASAILDATGCPKWTVDTFGGDAGGDSGGKDHIWRYYDPNSVTFNGCLAIGKPATRELVKVGDYYQYKVKLYNGGANNFSTVQIQDTLPSGVTYISAVPAPSNVSLPNLTWTVAPFLQSQMFEATVTVKASGSGLINNKVCASGVTTPGGQTINSCGNDVTVAGNQPLLRQTKTVTPTSAAPGDTVQYTITMLNVGSGPTSSPVAITEYLPTGFTYTGAIPGTVTATVNGASVTASVSGTAAQPVFTVPSVINAGQSLVLTFNALVSASTMAGNYTNSYRSSQGGVNQLTGAIAGVAVSRASIGDTVYRDWNGNGVQDPGEEGIPGIQVCANPGSRCATTDANGKYLIAGLQAGTYSVDVTNPPAGYTATQGAHPTSVTLLQTDNITTVDFGYRPGGAGSIGDKVFEDIANNGVFDGADVGINGVTVNLYEDTNGNGVIDAGSDLLIATTTTAGGGNYSFANLDPTRAYIVVPVDGPGSAVDAYFANAYVRSTTNPRPVSPANFAAQGNAVTDADFGYFGQTPGSIGDTVCVDVNGDKLCTGADQGIAGVTVRLYLDADGDGEGDPSELVTTTSTDPSGQYTFTGLGPGNYIVVVDTTDPQIPAGYLPSVSSQTAVTLAVAQNRTDVDFPFGKVLTKSVDKINANPGDTLNYSITANYPSGVLLQNVAVTDTIPAGTTFASAGQGGVYSGGAIVWNLGSNSPAIPATTSAPGTALCYGSTTLTAVEDTYIDLNNATSNFGSNNTMLTRPANAANIKHSLLRFDTSTIPANAQIQTADLRLVVTSNRSNHVDEVHRMITAWTEAGATWNDADGGGAGDWATGTFSANDYAAALLGKITPSSNGAKTLSVIGTVTDWVKNGVPNRGFVLVATGTDTGNAAYATRDNGTVANRPTLAVGYYYESPTACSGTTDLVSVADTFIREDSTGTANGTATTMITNPSTNGADGRLKPSLVQFNVVPIPSGATITSATLKLYVTTNKNNHVDSVRRMITSWTESATWNDADGAGAGDWATGTFGSSDYSGVSLGNITPNSNGQKSLVMTTQVNDWVNNGSPNRGLILYPTGTDNGDAKYATREDSTASRRPVLTVVWSQAVSTLPQTTLALHAEPLFLGGVGQIKVTMTASTAGTVTGVTPPAGLTINATGGASAVLNSGPTPAGPVTISAGSPASFVYIYNITPGSLPGTISFTGKPVPANNFGTATSEGVIISPALTFQVTVNNPATVGVVKNVANISAHEADTKLSPDLCYVVADNAPDTTTADRLLSIDPLTGDFVDIGATGTMNMEALASNLTGTALYGVEAGQLVTVDKDTGARTVVGTIGAINGTFGSIATPDVDGLAFDPADGKLYAVARREDNPITAGNTLLDVLFQINPTTGARVANAYGAGVDYIPIATNTLTPALYDVDDIVFDRSGVLYAIANDSTANIGLSDRLVTLNKATGAITDIAGFIDAADGTTAVTDVEDLAFLVGFGLLASTGDASTTSAQRNTVWTVDADTAAMTQIVAVPAYSSTDYEGLACMVGPSEPGDLILPPTPSNQTDTALGASIGDLVWADLDGDGVKDANEPGLAGVQVCATPTVGPAVCAVTDSQGAYVIGGLTAGTYTVAYTTGVPAGYTPSTPPSLSVPLTSGQQYKLADFGLRPPGTASIGDTVWLDANNNGSLDGAEQGLPNITVKLYIDQNNNGVVDVGDNLIQTQTTDALGNYLFSGLQPDDYLVVVDTTSPVTSPYDGTTTIAAAMAPTTGTTNPRDVTITTPGQTITNADFGYNWSSSIGDTVWWDDNLNQVVDAGEGRIANATVLLYFDANNNGVIDPSEYAPIAFMNTDGNGNYLFNHLPPGHYLVEVYDDSITTNGIRNIVSTTPEVRSVDLSPNQAVLTADFGYYVGARVKGNVFWDENGNGVLDPGEQNTPYLLPNVTVSITCLGPDGAPGGGDDYVGNQDTNAAGHFSFLVPPGPCTLTYDQNDIPAALSERTTPTTFTFVAQAGDDWHPSFDFGVDNRAAIGDTIYVDANGNGVQDAGEPGVAGVTVYLYQDVGVIGVYQPGIDIFMAAVVTDAQGKYSFPGLANGPYFVRVNTATLPAFYAQTGDPDQPGIHCTTCDNVAAAVIASGNDVLTMDFGYQYQPGGNPSATRTVSGVVWNDLNGNGIFDGGEPVLTGVNVTVNCGANGTFVTTTGALGLGRNWSVAGIPVGSNCTITPDPATLPPGYSPTTVISRTVTNIQNDVTAQNFGYQLLPGSISGTVVVGNGNGQADPGEPPLANVLITLRYAGADGLLGTPDDVVTTTNTNANGGYSFTNLLPGLYQVTETNPVGYVSVADRDGGNPDNITVNLGINQAVTGRDFEDAPISGSVSGVVFTDLNGDGVQGVGEAPISGVTVTLYGPGPDGILGTPDDVVIATTTTNASGAYVFSNLPTGPYMVRETDPAGYVSTTPNNVPVNVPPSGTATANFGDQPTGTISGIVFDDNNGNGVQNPTEPGLGGVTVQLINPVTGAVVATTTTDPNGAYVFTGVAPGAYIVRETDPAGYTSTTPNNVPVSVAPGGAANANFGDQQPATVVGTVFNDINGNGVQNPGETGISGVTVGLYNSGGALVSTTTTAADGSYIFSSVAPGSYTVRETDPAGYSSTTSNIVPVSVPAGGVGVADFGDQQQGTISGVVFNDANGNGVQDPGEGGLGGVTVQLVDPITGAVVATTTTNPNGSYTFSGVAPGSYIVRETDPSGFTSTTPNNVPVNVTPGGAANANFGDQLPGTVAGVVFNDLNGNGLQDPGEPGIGGVTVGLYNSSGNLVGTTTTVGNGAYLFTNVAPGAYTVRETDPAGYTSTTSNIVPVSVPAGGSANADFGDRLPGTVSGVVFNDLNGNGVQDPSEGGLGGVTVQLINPTTGAVVATTTTAADGSYTFTGVTPGSYIVRETDPTGFASTTPNNVPVSVPSGGSASANFGDQQSATVVGTVFNDINGDGTQDPGENGLGGVTVGLYSSGGALVATTTTFGNGTYLFSNVTPGAYTVRETDPTGYTSTTSNIVPVSVPAGGVGVADFGDRLPGSVSGVVYSDANSNGMQDPGENGLGGVTVQLINSTTGLVVATTTTAPNGSYLFTNVPPGSYIVRETDPTGFTSTTPNDVGVSVPSGGGASANFGDQLPGSVAGTVFNDLNGNGVQDPGENGLGGVTVGLYSTGGVLLASTTTAGDGTYIFPAVGPGSFSVRETDPSGWSSTTPNNVPVTVPSGGIGHADFGDQLIGSVSGVVFNDINGNGVQDPSENGIGGVTVGLYTSGGALVSTTTTAADGSYLFTGVTAGAYSVRETDPSGFTSTTPNDVPVSVPAGGAAVANFGDRQVGTVSGVVFNDVNSNGTQQPSENGLGGVTVGLYDSGNNLVATTTTAGDGSYIFTNVTPGSYTVRETDPPGFLSTTPNNVAVTVPAGGSASANFGDQIIALGAAQLSGMAYLDANGNGVHDPGETVGIPGVPVTIYGPNGVIITRTTTITGFYSVTNLPPGNYIVRMPNSLNSPTAVLSSPGQINVTLTSGQNRTGLDFGYVLPTGFTIVYFLARWDGAVVTVRWVAINEGSVAGYHIYRSSDPNGSDLVRITQQLVPVGGGTYQISDTSAVRGQTYWYWVQTQPEGLFVGPYPLSNDSKMYFPAVRKQR